MFNPIRTVILHYPIRFFLTILVILAIYVYVFRSIKGQYRKREISKKTAIIKVFLIYYVIMLLFLTVIGRRSWDYYRYNWELGYSYREVLLDGNMNLASQIVANIAVFVPIGIMGKCLYEKNSCIKCILLGLCFSLSIEFLQLVLKRGYCEYDDIVSNLIGTVIGCLIIMIYKFLKKLVVKKLEGENVF